jgi:hypothetical protein
MNFCRLACVLAMLAAVAPAGAARADNGFPFDRELNLDAPPMPGSKRVPGLEVAANGQATIDLWCASGRGQVVVAGDTITVIPGPMDAPQCPPERAQADAEMLGALSQVTHWRREGDAVVLIGPQPLRFHEATH